MKHHALQLVRPKRTKAGGRQKSGQWAGFEALKHLFVLIFPIGMPMAFYILYQVIAGLKLNLKGDNNFKRYAQSKSIEILLAKIRQTSCYSIPGRKPWATKMSQTQGLLLILI